MKEIVRHQREGQSSQITKEMDRASQQHQDERAYRHDLKQSERRTGAGRVGMPVARKAAARACVVLCVEAKARQKRCSVRLLLCRRRLVRAAARRTRYGCATPLCRQPC